MLLCALLHVTKASPLNFNTLFDDTWQEVKDEAGALPNYSADDDSSELIISPSKRRPKWSGFFCKITCGTCKDRLNIGVAALCDSECQRGVGESYMACLVTMEPSKPNYKL